MTSFLLLLSKEWLRRTKGAGPTSRDLRVFEEEVGTRFEIPKLGAKISVIKSSPTYPSGNPRIEDRVQT